MERFIKGITNKPNRDPRITKNLGPLNKFEVIDPRETLEQSRILVWMVNHSIDNSSKRWKREVCSLALKKEKRISLFKCQKPKIVFLLSKWE